ncbi:MAG: PD40 domain-containing protein [Acidobacteria bacterium]|nr:PD40 domain-containing protein [Acidobacteriota bacterium]
MSIKPVLSFRGVFVGAFAIIILGIATLAFGERIVPSALTDLFSVSAAGQESKPESGDKKVETKKADERSRPLGANDKFIYGLGNLPTSFPQRRDKILSFDTSGSSQELTAINDLEPAWSPDGTRIAFVSLRDGSGTSAPTNDVQYRRIYTMNADGSGQERVGGAFVGGQTQPSFSFHNNPVDQRIVFVADYSGQGRGIYTMDPYGQNHVRLDTDGCFAEERGRISKRGSLGPTALSPGIFDFDTPNFSPDNNYIIFGYPDSNDGTHDVYRINADGSNCLRIYDGQESSSGPTTARYSRDGSKIAIYIQGFGVHILRIIELSNGLPTGAEEDFTPTNFMGSPVWSPNPGENKIAYLAGNQNAENPIPGLEIRTIDLDTDFEELILSQTVPYGLNGMDWGIPSATVPALTLRINSPHPLLAGTSTTGTVTRSTPAPAGGVTITLQVFNPTGPGQTPILNLPANSVFIPEGQTQGTFQIEAPFRTDYRILDVYANSPTPNFGQAQATVSVTPARPDLRAISLSAPASVAPGVGFQLGWSIENIGQTTTGAGWLDQLYFSIDDQLDSTDVALPIFNNSGALAVGATRSISNITRTIPSSAAPTSGQYYLFLRTNPNEGILEGGRTTNNTVMTTIQINLPDIVAENLVLPSLIQPGVTYPVSWTTRNAGTATSGTFGSRLYYSPDATLGDANDILLDTVSNTALAPNATQNHNVNFNISTVPARPDGTAYFYVRADYGNNVYEGLPAGTGENNNTTTANTAFEYRVADLQVASTVAPAEVDTDAAFAMEWTTTNAGNKAAGTFSERVYFSPDNQVGGGDVLLGTFSLPGGLAVGASVNRIQNVTIPTSAIATTGNYFVYVQTDSSTNINEGENEGNNTRFQAVFVRRLLRPDLTITNIQAPNAAFFDQTIQVQWTVTNSGLGPTNASNWKDRVSMNTTGSPGGTLIDVNSISALAPGESYIASATVKVPRGYNGSYQIVVYTDIQGVLNEESTTNNKLTRPITINVPPLPDLTVSNVQAPEQAFAGGPINVSWQVNNIGNAAAAGDNEVLNRPWSWSDRVYLSRDTVLNTSQDRLIHTRSSRSTPLAAGASYSLNTFVATTTGGNYVLLPHDVEGQYYVFVLTDYSNVVYEFNAENNNFAYDEIAPTGSPINILATPADLVVNAQPTAPANASGGQLIDVSFTVTNQGAFATAGSWTDAIYLSTDQTFGDDTILGTKATSSLGPGGSRLIEMRVQLPECVTTGNYYLLARTDTGNAVAEFDPGYDAEANNNSPAKALAITTLPADLTATNVQFSPITMPGQAVTVSWTGSNLGTGPGPYQWVDRIVLKSLAGLGSAEVGRVTQQGALASGQSVARSTNVNLPTFMQGQYVITVQTDYSRNVTECGTGEDNNSADSASFSVSNNLPDLVVDSVSVPGGPVAVGTNFSIQYTGRNAGGQLTSAGGWRDGIYLSSNPTLSNSDRRIGYVNKQGNLMPGEAYTETVNVNTGNVPAGQYYILVLADNESDIYEGPGNSIYETNNRLASIPITVTSPNVDLQAVVNSVSSPTYSGMSASVTFTVTNTGATPTLTNHWTDYIILSRDSVIDSTDRRIGYEQHNEVLAGGASYQFTKSVGIPSGLTGLYRIFVVTDYHNNVSESSDLNNLSPGFDVDLQLPPPADLNVTNIAVPAGGTPGGSAVFNWTVQNSGQFPAIGPWRDSVYLSRDQFWDASDYLLGQKERVGPPLNVSQTEEITWGVSIPMIEEGNYYVIVRLDSQNRVRETNEANNVSVSVSQMPITVQTLTMNTPFMTQLFNGGTKSFKFDPPANETVLVSLTGEEGNSNELFTNFYSAASRADFDFQGSGERTDDQENFIPNTDTGRYYTMVSHDYIQPQDVLFDKQPEKIVNGQIGTVPVPPQNITISANVLPFSIHSVSPARAGNKGVATLVIKGAKFQSGLTLALEKTGQAPLVPIHLKSSSTVAVGVFELSGVAPGQYDVVITNPGGLVTRVMNRFEIVNGGGYTLTQSILAPGGIRPGQSRIRATFSVKNTGLNDALFVPVIISFRSSINYQIDPEDMIELPDEMLPSNINRNDVATHFDLDGVRYVMLMVPLLRSNTSANFGIDLTGLPSGSFDLAMAALPSLSDLRKSGGQLSPETLAAVRTAAPSLTAGECTIEFFRQLAFLLFDLVPGVGCADEAISAHAAIISYVSGLVMTDVTGGDINDAAVGDPSLNSSSILQRT